MNSGSSSFDPGRVLITADAVGGVWTYALELAEGLVDRGVEVVLAVLGPAPRPGQRRAAEAAGATVVAAGLALDWTAQSPAELALAARRLAALAAETGADLIHLNSPALAAGARFPAPVVGGCHSCLATWWDAVRGEVELPEDFRWRTELTALGYGACNALIAPSFAFAQATAARYGAVPHGVRNGRRPGTRRSDPQLKSRFVLTSGRLWDEGKNIAVLDAAAGLMRGQVQAAGALTGPGQAAATLNHILPLGSLEPEALSQCLNRAAVFASLALYEPFGLGVLEAAQAGCALVLSDIPTFRELWEGAAVFVDPKAPEAAAAVLDGLLENPAEAARLGALAAERAGGFTTDAMVEQTLAVYRNVLAARAPMAEAAA